MFKRILLVASLAAITTSQAQAFEIKGTIKSQAALTNNNGGRPMPRANGSTWNQKTVYLMKVNLSSSEKRELSKISLKTEKAPDIQASQSLPSKADVGMSNVPVLDQGQHGSCVTFATTAAIDALIGKGDYVSQLCNLELGAYIEQNSFLPSGWEGSYGPLVLEQTIGYGIVSKDVQKTRGCAGKVEYPLTNPGDTGTPMSLDQYHSLSEELSDFYWDPIITSKTRFSDDYEPSKLLIEIKKTIANNSPDHDTRITFGSLLPVDFGMAGATGRYHAQNDSWVLSKVIQHAILAGTTIGGHEMVITGYDDNATAIDSEGGVHKGLLTLRNSWGTDVGDKGNYYMSYDFFKVFVMEVQKVVKEKEE